MIDTEKEHPYSAAELSRLLAEKKNVQRSESCINNWIRRGTRGVKLESIIIGGQRCSTIEAYERFIEELAKEGK